MNRAGMAALAWVVASIMGPATCARAEGWRAGHARVDITPKTPLWMAGYGSRDHVSEGAVHPLWSKALVLADPDGSKFVLVTLDVCGIDREVSLSIRNSIKSRHEVPFDRIALACSHTHCGPVLGHNLITMYPINDEQGRAIKDYTTYFQSCVVKSVDEAIAAMSLAVLSWNTGRADFAVNRRENVEADVPKLRSAAALKGPVDHDVPVLRVASPEGQTKAVVFGYACHCTVLSFYQFCGDYAGFAQIAIENKVPGAQAMFVAGCGADQNPLPRRTIELAQKYGTELSEAVVKSLDSGMQAITGSGQARYQEIALALGKLPTRAEIEAEARSNNRPLANRARMLLAALERDGKLASTYPYPVQAWRLGELTWIFLGGEVVVDYSLRLKRNLGSSRTWVSGYSNDVMAYIPSLRVLKEGGYEGATSMIYYGLPTSWGETVEQQVIDAANALVKSFK